VVDEYTLANAGRDVHLDQPRELAGPITAFADSIRV
jgi:hypothetical protein